MGPFNGPVIAHGLYVCHHKSRYNVDCSAIHRDKICPLKETHIYMYTHAKVLQTAFVVIQIVPRR